METLANGYTLDIPQGVFPLSTDSVLLADFTKLPKNARVLDLGSGAGTLGLFLCAKEPSCRVTGVELSNNAHQSALKNISVNGLEERMESICQDIRDLSQAQKPGQFDVCVSNPPYFTGGPVSKETPNARREDTCSIRDLFAAASYALRYGGDLFLVHKPDRLAELCATGSNVQLEAKRLRLIRHRVGSEVSLVLLQFRKGGKPGLIWEECSLFDKNGAPTDEYQRIYHLQEARYGGNALPCPHTHR